MVSVIYNGADNTCAEVASATKLSAKLAGMVPRFGKFGEFWTELYKYAWFVSFGVSFVAYLVGMQVFVSRRFGEA